MTRVMASSGPHPDTHQDTPPDYSPTVSSTPASSTSTSPSPPAVTMAGATAASPQKTSHQQGQPFEPLDKAASQTVKVGGAAKGTRGYFFPFFSHGVSPYVIVPPSCLTPVFLPVLAFLSPPPCASYSEWFLVFPFFGHVLLCCLFLVMMCWFTS